MDYLIEKYSVNGNHFTVYQADSGKYWVSMSHKGETYRPMMIEPEPKTIAEVRKVIHTYAISQTNAELHGLQERLTRVQQTLNTLGSRNVFENLGKFRV